MASVQSSEFKVQGSKSSWRFYYLLALVFFAFGLMSKPMVVTLPFVLLLLDFWPLQRSSKFEVGSAKSTGVGPPLPSSTADLPPVPFSPRPSPLALLLF